MDAQRAMKIIRSRAGEFGVDPQSDRDHGLFRRRPIWRGFTAYQPERPPLMPVPTPTSRVSARPDFAVLLFPVVTLRKPYDTTRTRREIVGEKASAKRPEAGVVARYPCGQARAGPPSSLPPPTMRSTPPGHGPFLLFEKLVAAGASAEAAHVFRDGGHGWGLGNPIRSSANGLRLFEHWARLAQDM